MPSFTKKAIVASFLKLVAKKPFDKITVRDIVDDCGINRNTFYYYFQDIYAVLEAVCQKAKDALPERASLSDTLSPFVNAFVYFTKKYPRAAKGLALSFGFEGMERYFGKELDAAILDCVSREPRANRLPPDQQRALALFLRYAVIGFCLDVMRDESGSDPAETHAAMRAMLRRFSEQAENQ